MDVETILNKNYGGVVGCYSRGDEVWERGWDVWRVFGGDEKIVERWK